MSARTSNVVAGATTLSAVHPDILEAHILTRLDGPALASAGCCCSTLRSLCRQSHLWSRACYSTWPSTLTPRVSQVIRDFPGGGPASFFAHSFPLPRIDSAPSDLNRSLPPSELISAVDIHYRDNLIFSKVQETEAESGWFRCSPFRIDLLDPKEVVPTPINYPEEGELASSALMEDMKLSWIVIDPNGRLAVNLSSVKPVSVRRHWLSGEIQIRYATVLAGGGGDRSNTEFVEVGIVVNCVGSESGKMQVGEVSMKIEDLDGTHLTGRNSLVILHRALGCKRGKKAAEEKGEREGTARRIHEMYVEMKTERRERKVRREGRLDALCVALGITIFASLCFFLVLCR